ncbi:MAG: excinuclease ABC subunit UvrC [Alphaproteobacteria bacterium]|nr:excinuclease ABC subunit UvrC [Alphaproteobacteria bacterium]
MPLDSIKSTLPILPKAPGIYQFFDEKDELLYVGKAKNLQKRVMSYTNQDQLSSRISLMVSLTKRVEFTQTKNETEALLLEHDAIKKFRPKFNIVLRDDKTFPQILISDHQFPRIVKYRSNPVSLRAKRSLARQSTGNPSLLADERIASPADRNDGGKDCGREMVFGPFPSAGDVNRAIDLLRKSFLLRNCSDSEFKSRKKPCLEYQIKRCSAPCVGLVSRDDYQISVESAAEVLRRGSTEFLQERMKQLSEVQEYEKAALVRDQIQTLARLKIRSNTGSLVKKLSTKKLLTELKNIFDLPAIPKRIEVYDNSHISGTNAVGAMITAGTDGFIKSGYRKFNIRFEHGNRDDTAMLREVLTRRFAKAHDGFPDFVIIDGGKPQLAVAREVLKIPFVCMAKGEKRNAGKEWFHLPGKKPFQLEKNSPLSYYLQRLRDEAHRFAVKGHRLLRSKKFQPGKDGH